MSPIICPFCEEPSPPAAKFCSACGGALYLSPCPNCGAVNDVSAATCYQCRAVFPGRKLGAAEDTMAVQADASPASGGVKYARITTVIASLALTGALGYYVFLRDSPTVAPEPPLPAGEAAGQGTPASAGVIQPQLAPDLVRKNGSSGAESADAPPTAPAALATAPAVARSVPGAASSVPPARTSPTRAAASASPAARQTVESPKPKPAAALPSVRQGECTAAVAALGLCQPEEARLEAATSADAKTPEGAQPARAAQAPATKPAPAPVRSAEDCTEAVAALGLCTPATKDKAKGE